MPDILGVLTRLVKFGACEASKCQSRHMNYKFIVCLSILQKNELNKSHGYLKLKVIFYFHCVVY